MKILVKFQPEIPILMVMGGRLTRHGPKIDAAQLQSPQTLKLSWSTHNENFMA
jgi:hypothetical protein